MAFIKHHYKHCSEGYNRLKNLNKNELSKVYENVKLTKDKGQNLILLLDYLQGLTKKEFNEI